jgi:hypothetical protein
MLAPYTQIPPMKLNSMNPVNRVKGILYIVSIEHYIGGIHRVGVQG